MIRLFEELQAELDAVDIENQEQAPYGVLPEKHGKLTTASDDFKRLYILRGLLIHEYNGKFDEHTKLEELENPNDAEKNRKTELNRILFTLDEKINLLTDAIAIESLNQLADQPIEDNDAIGVFDNWQMASYHQEKNNSCMIYFAL